MSQSHRSVAYPPQDGHPNTLRESRQLLSQYPFSSVQPSTQAAQHLESATPTATAPSYIQPSLYNYENRSHLNPTFHQYVKPHHSPESGQYNPPFLSWPSEPAHTPNHLVYQPLQTMSGLTIASSSLANALLLPPSQTSKREFPRFESRAFFDNFLAEHDLRNAEAPPSPTKPQLNPVPSTSNTSSTSLMSPPVTPRKRRIVEVVIDTPSKRSHPQTPPPQREKSHSVGRLEAYVEVTPPPKSWGRLDVREDNHKKDPGRHLALQEDDMHSKMEAVTLRSGGRPSGRKTGDRDERVPLEKLISFVEEIFEAEDNICGMDPIGEDSPRGFFSTLGSDSSKPHLNSNALSKLTKFIAKVSNPSKRQRVSPREATAQSSLHGLESVGNVLLSRLFRMLERTVKSGTSIDPFMLQQKSQDSLPISDPDLIRFVRCLEIGRDSVLASECCLALLGGDRLSKQFYSEDLITACLATVKNQLDSVAYPYLELHAAQDIPPLLGVVFGSVAGEFDPIYTPSYFQRLLGEVFQALASVIPRINTLMSSDTISMSDTIVIQAVFISIGPFFVAEQEVDFKGKRERPSSSSTLNHSWMRALRTDSLSLICSVFAKHEDQRSWIIEEILGSLVKCSDSKLKVGTFRLRDGRSIRTVSALLLQLVQASAHHVRSEALRIAGQQHANIIKQDNDSSSLSDTYHPEHGSEEITLYLNALEGPSKAAKTIVLFLTQRAGKGKNTKNSHDLEYRSILDNLISDLLTVLFWPEWPAAGLVMGILCKFLIASLDDVKSNPQGDNIVVKGIALDHLGTIASHLRQLSMRNPQQSSTSEAMSLEEVCATIDKQRLEKLVSTHQEISAHLCRRSDEDRTCVSARELFTVIWGQELAQALVSGHRTLLDRTPADPTLTRAFILRIEDVLRDLWKDAPTDVFDNITQDEISSVDHLSVVLGIAKGLPNAFDPILNVILLALDASAVSMRTKALRALSQILNVDPNTLSNPNVRRAIEGHLLDSSPAVRDAAVELVGKFLSECPEITTEYYEKISERIADTGLGVRKRVIKLLKTIYSVADLKKQVDISTKLILRLYDEDETVQDLAIRTLEEIWFGPETDTSLRHATKGLSQTDPRSRLLLKASIIMAVSGNFKERQSPLEDVFHKMMSEKGGDDGSFRTRFVEICDIMIDGLVDPSDLLEFNVANCIKTIYVFAVAYPQIISGTKALTLLPYLKNTTTSEEQLISDVILRIFRVSIPHMPKTAAKFGNDLQNILQPMVIKPPPTSNSMAMQDTVACLCMVSTHLTHNYQSLAALLKSCNARMNQVLKSPNRHTLTTADSRALSVVVFIASLLVEHLNFDQLRLGHKEVAQELVNVSEGSISNHIYNSLLSLYSKCSETTLRARVLQCLGFIFKSKPTLMTLEGSASIMDAIFKSGDVEEIGRLLKLVQEFLVSESQKHGLERKSNVKDTQVDLDELVGNKQGFAESGVSSAIIQRYIEQIQEAATCCHSTVQSTAVDILSFTVRQGLAHPLQSFPVIIALETSPSSALSSRANALHIILHNKHASLLLSGYTRAAKAAYNYQRQLAGQAHLIRGYRLGPTSLFQKWFTIVREKRPARQEFLKAIMKVFEVDFNNPSEEDIQFVRFMAENVSSLEFKTQEDVLTVIKHLTNTLSTVGTQLVEGLAPRQLLGQLREGMVPDRPTTFPSTPKWTDRASAIRLSVVICIIMLLRSHLKTVYGMTEEKCAKWTLGKRSAVGDKPTSKRKEDPITWEILPFATAAMSTAEDLDAQQELFLDIWARDGLSEAQKIDDDELM